jgi:hypothetical protein
MLEQSAKKSSQSIIHAIAMSLDHDCEIEHYTKLTITEGDEIIIRISDGTMMGIALEGDKLKLRKSLDLPRIQSTGFQRINYWSRSYDLSNPKVFDHVLRLVKTNIRENSEWPHTS